MELRQYLRIIGIHRGFIFLMCLSAIVTSVLITYVISEKFRATTLVLIQPTENLEMTSTGKELLGFPFPITYNDPIKTINQTYSDLIKSRPIIESVVKELGLQYEQEELEPNFFRRIWKKSKKEVKLLVEKARLILMYGRIEESDPLDKVVTKIAKGLSVNPVKDTYLFEIECEFTEPRVAAAIANTAARIFVEHNREVSTKKAREVKEFVKERMDISEKELLELREALRQFKNRNDIAQLNKETELRLSSLSDFEDSMKKTDNSLQEIAASTEQIQQQLSKEEGYLKSSTTISNNPHVQAFRSELASLEVERAGLLQKFNPSHREVMVVQAKIDELNQKLRQETARIVNDETTILNPIHENLRRDLMSLESQKDALTARKEALHSVVGDYRKSLMSTARKEQQLSDLELRLRAAESSFLHLAQEYEDMRLNEAKRASEIRIAQEAVPPLYPSRPLKILYAGTSLLVSFLIGVIVAFIMEYVNVSIRSAQEAEQALNLPLLSTIPEVPSLGSETLPLVEPLDSAQRLAVDDVGRRGL